MARLNGGGESVAVFAMHRVQSMQGLVTQRGWQYSLFENGKSNLLCVVSVNSIALGNLNR